MPKPPAVYLLRPRDETPSSFYGLCPKCLIRFRWVHRSNPGGLCYWCCTGKSDGQPTTEKMKRTSGKRTPE